ASPVIVRPLASPPTRTPLVMPRGGKRTGRCSGACTSPPPCTALPPSGPRLHCRGRPNSCARVQRPAACARSGCSRSQQTARPPSNPGVVITHPFHPFQGQCLPLLYRGACEGVEWVALQLPDGSLLRIPVEWTDLSVPDAYQLAGQGRASFRVP